MMNNMLRVPGVKFTALCDVYEPRFGEGREITGEDTPIYRNYRDMLDRAELDAVLMATPLSYHADHVTACLERDLHVYGEKSMGFTPSDCNRIVSAARRTDAVFQVGHQYRYAPWYRQAIRRIREGEIGEVNHVYAYWHRNYNWRRPVPDPSLERLINWRLYREYSGGLLAELGSHHIDVANWIFNDAPESVTGSGGINFYHDGRETYDNVQAVYNYPKGQRLVFSSIIGNHHEGFQIWIYGTGGSVQLTLQDGFFYYEPARDNSAVPQEMIERGVNTAATLATEGDMPYRGAGAQIVVPQEEQVSPDFRAVQSFFDSIREGTKPFANEEVGWRSAMAVALGNHAIYERMWVNFKDYTRKLSDLQ